MSSIAGPASKALMEAAVSHQAGLLIMGGYGHSHMREIVFGGFTQSVLESAETTVFLMRYQTPLWPVTPLGRWFRRAAHLWYLKRSKKRIGSRRNDRDGRCRSRRLTSSGGGRDPPRTSVSSDVVTESLAERLRPRQAERMGRSDLDQCVVSQVAITSSGMPLPCRASIRRAHPSSAMATM
jgi:hypothetical protein